MHIITTSADFVINFSEMYINVLSNSCLVMSLNYY